MSLQPMQFPPNSPGGVSHGLIGIGTLVAGLAALGGLSLACYQQFVTVPQVIVASNKNKTEIKKSDDKLEEVYDSYQFFDELFGAKKEDMIRLRSQLEEASKISDKLNQDIEAASQRIHTLERQLNAFAGAIEDVEIKPVLQSNIDPTTGEITLQNQNVVGVKVYNLKVTRSGDDVIISGEMMSPKKDMGFYFGGTFESIAITEDGTEISISAWNISNKGWTSSTGQNHGNLRYEVPISIQWKFRVPLHHKRFRLIELFIANATDNEKGRMRFRNIGVPIDL